MIYIFIITMQVGSQFPNMTNKVKKKFLKKDRSFKPMKGVSLKTRQHEVYTIRKSLPHKIKL